MRFFSPGSPGKVLGINRRNLEYIFALNPRERFPLADDKVESKKLLREAVQANGSFAESSFIPPWGDDSIITYCATYPPG